MVGNLIQRLSLWLGGALFSRGSSDVTIIQFSSTFHWEQCPERRSCILFKTYLFIALQR